jgi:hypothetical protein
MLNVPQDWKIYRDLLALRGSQEMQLQLNKILLEETYALKSSTRPRDPEPNLLEF